MGIAGPVNQSSSFVLRATEGLTKGKIQSCSHILIIYCSAVHITVHSPPGMAHQAEEEVSLSLLSRIPADLVASSITSVGSLASDMSERKNTRRRKMTELPFLLLL